MILPIILVALIIGARSGVLSSLIGVGTVIIKILQLKEIQISKDLFVIFLMQ